MLSFTKLVGTGNDFIFIDLREKSLTSYSKEHLAQKICDRHFGVGADGIIYVEQENQKFKWDFYNRDGSQAEFCGNAARCFGSWAKHVLNLDELIFGSRIGEIKVTSRKVKNENHYVVQLHQLTAVPKAIDLKVKEFAAFGAVISQLQNVFLVNTGVPHFVCHSLKPLSHEKKLKVVGAFRFHPSTGLAGANVTFLCADETETFERGVEDFTLSCGTGVVAAAITLWKIERATDVLLKTPGGSLRVEILQAQREEVTKANLIGPAEFICDGKFAISTHTELEKK